MKFLSFGGFRIRSVVSSSKVQFPSGSFGFVCGWTDPRWSLWLRACNWGIWRPKKACYCRENSQAGHSPARSPLMVLRHTLLSSVNRAQSISAPNWADLTEHGEEVELIITYNTECLLRCSLMFMWHLKKRYNTMKLYLSADERLCMSAHFQG